MRLGIFAKTFAGADPLTVLRAAQGAGYAGVQYNMACSGLPPMPDEVADTVVAAINAAQAETGVRLEALSATYNMAHPDAAVRADGLRRLAVLAPVARAIGAPMLTLCTGTRDAADQWRHHPDNATPEAWRDMITSIEGAVAIAEAHGLTLGIEPEMANIVSSTATAKRLLDEVQSDCLRIVLDPANQFEEATPDAQRGLVETAVEVLGHRIAMAHAKDRRADGSFATAGKGMVDFPHFITALRGIGFDGPLVTHGLAADEATVVAAFLRGLL